MAHERYNITIILSWRLSQLFRSFRPVDTSSYSTLWTFTAAILYIHVAAMLHCSTKERELLEGSCYYGIVFSRSLRRRNCFRAFVKRCQDIITALCSQVPKTRPRKSELIEERET